MELLHKVRNLEHIKLAAVFVGLNIVDAVLTEIIMDGGGSELNPMMRYFLGQPRWVFWTVKLGGSIILASTFLLCATVYPRLIKIILIFLVILGTVVCLLNGIGLLRA